jgi:hypothetical protein
MEESGAEPRGPIRGGCHEGRSLSMGRTVRLFVFARHVHAARFGSSCEPACGRIRFAGCGTHSSWAGYAVDPLRAVPASTSNGASHASRAALLEQLEQK